MKKDLAQQVHKLQCLFWFNLGDIIYYFPWRWCFKLYQYSMEKSIEINDKYDLKIWKNGG